MKEIYSERTRGIIDFFNSCGGNEKNRKVKNEIGKGVKFDVCAYMFIYSVSNYGRCGRHCRRRVVVEIREGFGEKPAECSGGGADPSKRVAAA